jgi:hypothetical protein
MGVSENAAASGFALIFIKIQIRELFGPVELFWKLFNLTLWLERLKELPVHLSAPRRRGGFSVVSPGNVLLRE